ncbi:hypothetical protein [Sphingobium xenophagum]|uniref:hypothetical protein n=1 Tax=Sphingobium xenophagum TaxID=121428 RepID=UPI0036D2537D|tara:strand:+ start:2005 stop:2277 length:273 start_codon:yes stop_codon:yes gene_type:complete
MAGTVFFITAHSNAPQVEERLSTFISENDMFKLRPDEWMVTFEGAARDLAEKAGIRGGDERIGTGLVLPVTTYSGRAATELWDWLREKGL